MKRAFSLLAVLATGAGIAMAQVPGATVQTLLQDDPDIRAFTGATDSDPNGLQVLSDGRIVFFESESTAGNNAQDAVILFNPSLSGTARFSVLASEAALAALIGESTPDIFAEDMAKDSAGNIYVLAAQARTAGDDYFVAKIPNTGSGFGIPELIAGPGVAPLGIPPTEGFGSLEFDPANNRLILLLSENVDETDLSGIAGLYTLPILPGQASPLQMLAPRTSLISALTPIPETNVGDRGTFDDMTVLPNGDIVATFNVRSGTQVDGDSDGDVIVVSSAGTPTLLIDATDLRTDVTGLFGATTTYVDYNPARGAIALLEEFTSFADRNLIAEYSTNGTFIRVVADQADILENSGATSLRVFSRAFDSSDAGDYYVFTGLDNETCQRISISDETDVPSWHLYQ